MIKKRTNLGTRLLSLLLSSLMVASMALPGGAMEIKAQAAENDTASGNVVLALSTEEILNTVARIAGPAAVDLLQNADPSGEQPLDSLTAENLDLAEIVVEADEVTPKDKSNNEVAVSVPLPQAQTQQYYVDREMEQFISGLQIPESSKLMEQNLLAPLQGLWFVKAYEGSGYQAAAMLDPETLELQVSFINSSSGQKTFTLSIQDADGQAVEASEVSAMLHKAATHTLTPEELEKYQAQGNISVEVIAALAEWEDSVPLGHSGQEWRSSPTTLGFSGPALLGDASESGANLVEVTAIVIESQEASAGERSSDGYAVPCSSLFTGRFDGITPFGLNHTVEYYIGTTLYKGPFLVAAGSAIGEEPAPDFSQWPSNTTAFNGWFQDGATLPFDFSTSITENLRLYGRFSDGYVITYKNGDGQVIDTKILPPNSPIPETSQTVVPPDGQRLMHWYVEGTDPTQAFVFGTTATKDIILRPHFSNQFYVIFMSEGTQVDPQTVIQGQRATKPADPVRDGYNFSHWSTAQGGAIPYNFSAPITDNLMLYAAWTPKTVNYKVVYWVEKANFSGDPGNDWRNYNYAFSATMSATAGSQVSLTAAQTDPKIDPSLTAQGSVNPLRFSTFSHSDTVTIAGNGTTTVNVYYKRVEYTYNFYIDYGYQGTVANPTRLKSNGVYYNAKDGEPTLPIKAKYQQDITAFWPELEKGGGLTNYEFYGWSPPAEITTQFIWTTRRYYLTADMISVTNPTTSTIYTISDSWMRSADIYTVEYWLESIDGTGAPFTTDRLRYFKIKDEYTQDLANNGTLNPKKLDGFIENVNWASGTQNKGDVRRFYYNRVNSTLSFDSKGGNAINSEELMYETPLASHKPVDPIRAGYTFTGWFLDADYKEPFDFSTATMPKDNLELYARWDSNAFTVSYYDRLGGGTVLKTQGYAPGAYVAFPMDLYQPGDIVNGYGQFLGWKWIVPGTNIFTEFSVDIPVRRDIDLYATWKTSGFTVRYDRGNGTGTPPSDTNVYDIGRSVALKDPANLTPPPSEVFYGWKPEGSTSGQLYFPRNLYAIQGDTKFVAQYGDPDNAYKVTFDAGYPGNQQATVVWYVPKSSPVYLLDSAFTRPNATLIGWSETQGAAAAQYGLGELLNIDGNKTLYGVWSINAHNIYFQSDPDKGELSDNGVYADKVVYEDIIHGTSWGSAIIRGVPTVRAKAGYYFTGWSPTIPANNSTITADKTYVAQFAATTSIVLTAGSASKIYDGTPLTNNTINPGALNTTLYSVESSMEAASTITDAGSSINKIESYKIIRNSDSTDVTEQFAVTLQTGTLTVTKRAVTVTADNKNKVYGDSDPALTATAGNVPVTGDAVNYTLARDAGENTGTYPIKVTLGSNPNYTVTAQNGTLTITQQSGVMSATAGDVNVVYDGQSHGIVVNVSGVSSGYTVKYSTSATGPFALTQPSKVNVADTGRIYYEVSHPNHVAVTGSAMVTIAKRNVMIKADDVNRTYTGISISVTVGGNAVPGGHGLAGGHTVSVVAKGTGTQSGTYTIAIESAKIMDGIADVSANYNITQQAGTLTIDKIALTIQVASAVKNAGAPDPPRYNTALKSGTLQSGDTVANLGLVFERDPGEAAGTYAVRVTLVSDKYIVTCIPGVLTIRPTGGSTR